MAFQFFNPCHWFHLVFGIAAIVILARILSGQTYIRQPITDIVESNGGNVSNQPSSIDRGLIKDRNCSINPESWPFKMTLGLDNYVCSTPIINPLEVTEDEVIAAWHLPPKTNMSPRMRQIGQCHVVFQKLASRGSFFDTSQCNCVNSWPANVFEGLLLGLAIDILCLIFGGPIEIRGRAVRFELKLELFLHACCFYLIWFITTIPITNYLIGHNDLGVWYTLYGSVRPINYYYKSPDWESILLIIYIGSFTMATICIGMWIIGLVLFCCPSPRPRPKKSIKQKGHSVVMAV